MKINTLRSGVNAWLAFAAANVACGQDYSAADFFDQRDSSPRRQVRKATSPTIQPNPEKDALRKRIAELEREVAEARLAQNQAKTAIRALDGAAEPRTPAAPPDNSGLLNELKRLEAKTPATIAVPGQNEPEGFITSQKVTVTHSLEAKEPLKSEDFSQRLPRYEVKLDFTHGDIRDHETVWSFSPSAGLTRTDATNALGSIKRGNTVAPTFLTLWTPLWLNWGYDEKTWPVTKVLSLSAQRSFTQIDEVPPSALPTSSEKVTTTIIAAFDYSRDVRWPFEENPSDFRIGPSWTHKEIKERKSDMPWQESSSDSASLGFKGRCLLRRDGTLSLTLSATWDFPVFDHPAPEKAPTGDGTLALSGTLTWKFIKGKSLSLDYRSTLDDRNNKTVARYQMSIGGGF